MSLLQPKTGSMPAAVEAKLADMEKANPSNAPEKEKPSRRRIPMSVPNLRLTVPEIPGYKLRWMRGDVQRIAQATAGGYEFVAPEEVNLNTFGLGNGPEHSGNGDLGNRVSVAAGGGDITNGQATRLYLMKIRDEFWMEDEEQIAQSTERLAAQLRGDAGFAQAGGDNSNRYSKGENRNMFQPRRA